MSQMNTQLGVVDPGQFLQPGAEQYVSTMNQAADRRTQASVAQAGLNQQAAGQAYQTRAQMQMQQVSNKAAMEQQAKSQQFAAEQAQKDRDMQAAEAERQRVFQEQVESERRRWQTAHESAILELQRSVGAAGLEARQRAIEKTREARRGLTGLNEAVMNTIVTLQGAKANIDEETKANALMQVRKQQADIAKRNAQASDQGFALAESFLSRLDDSSDTVQTAIDNAYSVLTEEMQLGTLTRGDVEDTAKRLALSPAETSRVLRAFDDRGLFGGRKEVQAALADVVLGKAAVTGFKDSLRDMFRQVNAISTSDSGSQSGELFTHLMDTVDAASDGEIDTSDKMGLTVENLQKAVDSGDVTKEELVVLKASLEQIHLALGDKIDTLTASGGDKQRAALTHIDRYVGTLYTKLSAASQALGLDEGLDELAITQAQEAAGQAKLAPQRQAAAAALRSTLQEAGMDDAEIQDLLTRAEGEGGGITDFQNLQNLIGRRATSRLEEADLTEEYETNQAALDFEPASYADTLTKAYERTKKGGK